MSCLRSGNICNMKNSFNGHFTYAYFMRMQWPKQLFLQMPLRLKANHEPRHWWVELSIAAIARFLLRLFSCDSSYLFIYWFKLIQLFIQNYSNLFFIHIFVQIHSYSNSYFFTLIGFTKLVAGSHCRRRKQRKNCWGSRLRWMSTVVGRRHHRPVIVRWMAATDLP